MQITLLAVGQKPPAWVAEGYHEYAKRMPPHARLVLKEIKAEPRQEGGQAAESAMRAEGERILAALPRGSHLIVLDERGKHCTSAQLALHLKRWLGDALEPAFVIGGADGLAAEVKSRAAEVWSLSAFTLPHGLARVLLAEQLYRAWTILEGHPYHRV